MSGPEAKGWCVACEGEGWLWLDPHPLDDRGRSRKVLCLLCKGTGEEGFDCACCRQMGALYRGTDGFSYCSDLCEADRLDRDGEGDEGIGW